MKLKRILAMIAIVLLATMYLATLILAFVRFPGSERIFGGLVLLDIALPLFLWILIYVYKHFGNREE